MERSRRELSINVVAYRCIFKNNQITPSLSFAFIPKTEILDYPKPDFFLLYSFGEKNDSLRRAHRQ